MLISAVGCTARFLYDRYEPGKVFKNTKEGLGWL